MKRCCRQHRSRGSVLIVTMIAVFALAAMVLSLTRSMRTELLASANSAASIQADEVERGAEQYVIAMLADQGQNALALPESNFSAVQVGDGYFWIVRPNYDDPAMPVFGLMDEAGKINLNTISTTSYTRLFNLPGMSQDLAQAIADWRDPNSTATYYQGLADPYSVKRADFETVEELLLVQGMDPTYLYGDGTAPPLGQYVSSNGPGNGTSAAGAFDDPQLARGVYDLFTVYSAESPTTSDGQQRIALGAAAAAPGGASTVLSQLQTRITSRLSAARATAILRNFRANSPPTNIVDLYRSGQMTRDELDTIADDLSPSSPTGRININTAPRNVLLCLPNITTADVDKIIAARPVMTQSSQTPAPQSVGWFADAMGSTPPIWINSVTWRATQYSADIVAVSGNGRAFKRCRIVVDTRDSGSSSSSTSAAAVIGSATDASSTLPRIVYRRDITGRGWPMDPQILASIRSGAGAAGGPSDMFDGRRGTNR